MNNQIFKTQELMCKIAQVMFDRNLTDLAGGNISVQVEDRILVTPSLASNTQFWILKPEDILILDLDGNKLEGKGKVTRELVTHLSLLRAFYPRGSAVIHAHPRNVMVFCATQQPIPPVLECTVKFGEIKVVDYAHGGVQSEILAQNVLGGLQGQEERISKQAAAVLAPFHGIFAIGKDLNSTLDAVERIEVNARCILFGKILLQDNDRLDASHQALFEAMKAHGSSGEE